MKRLSALIVLVALIAAIPSVSHAKKKQVFRSPGGTNIAPIGLAVDASYDQRFDGFVPGYKMVSVAMINQSFDIVYLDPEKDRWSIKLAGRQNVIPAIHDLRRADPKAWTGLSEKTRELVAYPLFLPIGARQVIDIFVPEAVDAADFNEVKIFIRSLNVTLEILARQ